MTSLRDALRRMASDLQAEATEWALVGGLAVSARTTPRFTGDVDLAVSVPTDRAAERLVRALRERGWAVDMMEEQDATERLATVRFVSAEDEGPVVDLLFASSGIEAEVVSAAERVEVFADQRVLVARLGHLIALKLLARADDRPQDEVDLHALMTAAGPADLAMARDAVGLIQTRGFARGRDLTEALEHATRRRRRE